LIREVRKQLGAFTAARNVTLAPNEYQEMAGAQSSDSRQAVMMRKRQAPFRFDRISIITPVFNTSAALA